MIEAFVEGDDHRLMVVDGRLVAAIRRDPPTVVGDGQRSVRSLIDGLNQGRGANLVASHYRRAVKIDDVVMARLRQQGLDLDGVPGAGLRVGLRSNSNLSTGGSCTDVTARVHPAVQRLAEAIATTLGLETCGVDYITTDISRPWRDTGGAVIEVNATPGMAVSIAAGVDEVLLGTQVLGSLPGRLPVALLVAPASLQQAWLPGLLAEAGRRPGWAWLCGGESGVGDLPVSPAGRPFHECVAMLLRNRLTDSLLVMCTSAELQKEGVPVDRLDRVLVCQQDFPAAWMGVLGAVAASVQRVDDPAAAWDAFLPR
jgi:cyanophycin synthetase